MLTTRLVEQACSVTLRAALYIDICGTPGSLFLTFVVTSFVKVYVLNVDTLVGEIHWKLDIDANMRSFNLAFYFFTTRRAIILSFLRDHICDTDPAKQQSALYYHPDSRIFYELWQN